MLIKSIKALIVSPGLILFRNTKNIPTKCLAMTKGKKGEYCTFNVFLNTTVTPRIFVSQS